MASLEVWPSIDGAPARFLAAARGARPPDPARPVEEKDAVLDVGCATGYSTAVLARLARVVTAVEAEPELAAAARETLQELGVANATVIERALTSGAPESGPFDVILLNGSVPEVPDTLLAQLKEGGRLCAIIAAGREGRPRQGKATLFVKVDGEASGLPHFDVNARLLPGFAPSPGFYLLTFPRIFRGFWPHCCCDPTLRGHFCGDWPSGYLCPWGLYGRIAVGGGGRFLTRGGLEGDRRPEQAFQVLRGRLLAAWRGGGHRVSCLGSHFLARPAAAETLMEALANAYLINPVLNAERANLRATDEQVAVAKSGGANSAHRAMPPFRTRIRHRRRKPKPRAATFTGAMQRTELSQPVRALLARSRR